MPMMTGGFSGGRTSLRARARSLPRRTRLRPPAGRSAEITPSASSRTDAEPDQVAGVDEGRGPVGAGQEVVHVLPLHHVDGAGHDDAMPATLARARAHGHEEAEDDRRRHDEPRQRRGDEQGGRAADGTDERAPAGSAASPAGAAPSGRVRRAGRGRRRRRARPAAPGGSGPAGPRRRRGRCARTQRRARRGRKPRTRQRSRVAPETASAAQIDLLGGPGELRP